MPKKFPPAFKRVVVAVARRGDLTLNEVAADFDIPPESVRRWMRQADIDDGVKDGLTFAEPSCTTRSSTGSSTPTTAAGANAHSASSPRSSSNSPSPPTRLTQHDQSQPVSTGPTADPTAVLPGAKPRRAKQRFDYFLFENPASTGTMIPVT